MPSLYPAVEPFDQGMLDVGDGQRLHWRTCGRADGKPAVVLHGGPGSGCSAALARRFDPDAYRVVLVDQRGAGRSTPSAADPAISLATNTTAHLVADLEVLREHLGIGRWLVHGLSWGSTLALAYAEGHPDRVSELVLAPVTLTRSDDVRWLTVGVGRFFPEQWARFHAAAQPLRAGEQIVDGYARLLADPDPQVRDRAARAWCDWEDTLFSVESGGVPDPRYADPRFRFRFARTVTHYFRHAAFLADGQLLRDAHRLAGIPGVLVHGRLDLGGPPRAAWELARAWPGSELTVLDSGGHASAEMTSLVVAATDRFATAEPVG